MIDFDLYLYSYIRSRPVWFVGNLLCYFSHIQSGEKSFLVLVLAEVIKKHEIDSYTHAPKVTENSKGLQHAKYAVFSTTDILSAVCLIQYNSLVQNIYSEIWPYCKYYEQFVILLAIAVHIQWWTACTRN
jgi:hypothetical protein